MAHGSTVNDKILNLLRQNARISNAELAKQVGISQSACSRRLRALEENGVIRGYTVILADPKEGRKNIVVVQITLERQTREFLARFEAAVRKCPEIRDCYLMGGIADYLLHIEVSDIDDYVRTHSEVLSRLPGVTHIQSNFVIKNVTRDYRPQ